MSKISEKEEVVSKAQEDRESDDNVSLEINNLSNQVQGEESLEDKINKLKNEEKSVSKYWKKISEFIDLDGPLNSTLNNLRKVKKCHDFIEIKHMKRHLEKSILLQKTSLGINPSVFLVYITIISSILLKSIDLKEPGFTITSLIVFFMVIIVILLILILKILARIRVLKTYLIWVETIEDFYSEKKRNNEN